MLFFSNGRGFGSALMQNRTFKTWVSRTFLVTIVAYLAVLGYLVSDEISGGRKLAPYGVNMPLFIALVIVSEVIMTFTLAVIFREDKGIWPESVQENWTAFRNGSFKALGKATLGLWDLSLIDLRLRTTKAIWLGRINRLAGLVPLAYAVGASLGQAPLGLVVPSLLDIIITLVIWFLMELVMVKPEPKISAAGGAIRG